VLFPNGRILFKQMGRSPNHDMRGHSHCRGFSFLELLGASLLFSGCLALLFPLVQVQEQSQMDLFKRYQALKFAESHLISLFSSLEPLARNEKKVMKGGESTYTLNCSVAEQPNHLKKINVQVQYPTGKNHATVSLSTLWVQ
jgi:hypothetical protein